MRLQCCSPIRPTRPRPPHARRLRQAARARHKGMHSPALVDACSGCPAPGTVAAWAAPCTCASSMWILMVMVGMLR
jgi:hypothetical protein